MVGRGCPWGMPEFNRYYENIYYYIRKLISPGRGEVFGSALYYPHIDIHDPKWLRSAVLFWDSLQTIVPRAVKSPYKNSDTNILWREGFLDPLRCDLHPDLLDVLGKRVVSLMDSHFTMDDEKPVRRGDPNHEVLLHVDKVGARMRSEFRRARMHPEKMSPELRSLAMRSGLAHMHPEKFSPEIHDLLQEMDLVSMHPEKISPLAQRYFREAARFRDHDGEWLLLDSRFAETYMSALAALLSKEVDMAALTNEEPSMGVNLHSLLEDIRPSHQSEKKGALISFVMEMIRVDPETRIDKILNFRRSRVNQLAELSAQFDDISSKISNCETASELEEEVRIIYQTRVRPKLESLKDELKDNYIQSAWDGFQRAVTISVPAGGALSYFTGTSAEILLCLGAAIAITDVSVKTHLAQKKMRRASPYTYLLDIERKFSVAA